jgi:hypothetical protein
VKTTGFPFELPICDYHSPSLLCEQGFLLLNTPRASKRKEMKEEITRGSSSDSNTATLLSVVLRSYKCGAWRDAMWDAEQGAIRQAGKIEIGCCGA